MEGPGGDHGLVSFILISLGGWEALPLPNPLSFFFSRMMVCYGSVRLTFLVPHLRGARFLLNPLVVVGAVSLWFST